MDCPLCSNAMVEIDISGTVVDFCRNGCGGLWFDASEVVRSGAKDGPSDAVLRDVLTRPRAADKVRDRLKCPKCGIPMQVHKFRTAPEVDVDECYGCGGLFLDAGELAAIRSGSLSEDEAKEYHEKLIREMPAYREAQRELAEKLSGAESNMAMTDIFSFLSGIYNINR